MMKESKQQRNFRIGIWDSILTDFCKKEHLSLNKLNNHQYRVISDKIKFDVYPVSKRYHKIKPHQERGDLKNLPEWLYMITYNKTNDTSTIETAQAD
jgi:hypothetical protein